MPATSPAAAHLAHNSLAAQGISRHQHRFLSYRLAAGLYRPVPSNLLDTLAKHRDSEITILLRCQARSQSIFYAVMYHPVGQQQAGLKVMKTFSTPTFVTKLYSENFYFNFFS